MWSDNPTENQLLQIFNTETTFKIMRLLMKHPQTIEDMAKKLENKNYNRIYNSIKILEKAGLIKIKEYIMVAPYSKKAVFMSTIKNLNIKLGMESEISTDTKLVLHSEGFQ